MSNSTKSHSTCSSHEWKTEPTADSRLKQLCSDRSDLSEDNLERLELLAKELPLMAALTDADVFIDCFSPDGDAYVAAHAKPSTSLSAYSEEVIGAGVRKDKEPAVYHAFSTGMPVCDLKAVTQELKTVRQNAAPVMDDTGRVIAVLVREKDISETLRRDRKLEELSKSAPLPLAAPAPETAAIREMNHRIKNNLQLIAGILNLQAAQSEDSNVKAALQENIARVLSIAAIHDLTAISPENDSVSIQDLLGRLVPQLTGLLPERPAITITADGDDFQISSKNATAIVIVLSELTTNAIQHAFEGKESGSIVISAIRGVLYHTLLVQDDGCGFNPDAVSDSLGLSIVRATVHDQLGGKLRMQFDVGTKISFDFPSQSV